MDAHAPSVRVRRRLYRETAVSERELHLRDSHDRAGLDGAADPRLAGADGTGRQVRAAQAVGLSADHGATADSGRDVVADQSSLSLLKRPRNSTRQAPNGLTRDPAAVWYAPDSDHRVVSMSEPRRHDHNHGTPSKMVRTDPPRGGGPRTSHETLVNSLRVS